MEQLIELVIDRREDIVMAAGQHLRLTFLSLAIANAIAIPLGILITRYKKIAEVVLGVNSVMQTIPSIALLGFLLPFFGIGTLPAVIALTIYGLLPIMRNTYTGIKEVDPVLIEVGTGMGMTSWQILFMVELPLAFPVIMAGIRTAGVIIIGTATLSALIGAGGLGDLIFRGIATVNTQLVLAGAIPAAFFAVSFNFLVFLLERKSRRGRAS